MTIISHLDAENWLKGGVRSISAAAVAANSAQYVT